MITVHGRATPEEIAAVLTVLRGLEPAAQQADEPGGYEGWRARRIAALRRTPRGPGQGGG